MLLLLLASPLVVELASGAQDLAPYKMLNRKKQRPGEHRQSHSSMHQVLVRPSAGKGADKIQFGLMAKSYYGTNMKEMYFKMDVIMSLGWVDHRVTHLIPAHLDKLTMSTEEASSKVWMPEIGISNRDIDKYEIISSAVSIFKTGEVLRVERAQVRISELFELTQYPFDTQHLHVKIASSKYMADEIVLVPSPVEGSSGVVETFWGSFDLQGWNISTFEEKDADLIKSRGVLDVVVKRNLEKYGQDHLMPTFIILTVSWAVFFMPFHGPFVTPRLVLSILALLVFTQLIIKSQIPLPGAAPFNWNDLLNQQIQMWIFATVVINMFSEILHHTFHLPERAEKINFEAKVLIPVLSSFNVILTLTAGQYKWVSLDHAALAAQTISVITLVGYIVWTLYMTRKDMKAKEMRAVEKAAAAAAK